MNLTKYITSLLCCLLISFISKSQDCTLNIGGEDDETIISVFQLNEEQQGKMEAWGRELQFKNKVLEDGMQKLLDTHPQSKPEDVVIMGEKYKKLKDEFVANSKEYDIKLLTLFNEKQYRRYVDLCREAFRRPLNRNSTIPE
ncbi:hypothetical protein GGR42_002962 [Saonia flava]|uniref:Uncharacterized protein n=1 Tax=Saonia flava TaxID=523696 RepID=A0A846QVY2_9FLAO|nr:hypothetical protein [Saonia flava]NJB72471.1 hypothetical protein [Saonia flava]